MRETKIRRSADWPRHPICGRCRHSGYGVEPSPGDQRPAFRCWYCGYTWTAGLDGEPYLARALKLAGLTYTEWHEMQDRAKEKST